MKSDYERGINDGKKLAFINLSQKLGRQVVALENSANAQTDRGTGLIAGLVMAKKIVNDALEATR